MKNKLLVTLAFFFQTTIIFSQVSSKGNISITIGPTFPTGQFVNTNLYDESSGFAIIGESISLSYAKPISKKFAFLINLSGQRNPINTYGFENAFSNAKFFQGVYFGTEPNNPPQTNFTIYPNWKFEKKSWLYTALQIGGKGQFPLNAQNNIQLITNLTIGALYATSPDLKGNSITDTASAHITQSKSSGFGLIYTLGCGLNYHLNKRMFLISTVNYTGSNNVTFKNIKSTLTTTKGTYGTPEYTIQQSQMTANGKQKFNSINLLFGIGISL